MRKGHVCRQCDTSIKCNFCKDKHHAALCLKKFKSVESGCTSKGTTAFVIPKEKVKEEVVEKKGSVGTVGVNNLINSGNLVFLQTAKVMCDSPDNNISRSVRLIFDSASQYTFVAKEVVKTLKLKPARTEKLLLSTFGNEIEEIKTFNVFELSVRNPETGFVQVIQAYEVPMICNDLVGQDLQYVKKRFAHLQGIKFSDETPSGEHLHLDILIGSDLLWSLSEGQVIKRERGSLLQF